MGLAMEQRPSFGGIQEGEVGPGCSAGTGRIQITDWAVTRGRGRQTA